jgi:hypothetical protein
LNSRRRAFDAAGLPFNSTRPAFNRSERRSNANAFGSNAKLVAREFLVSTRSSACPGKIDQKSTGRASDSPS